MEKGTIIFTLTTFTVNLAFSVSMYLLWSMINTMQIIVHLPLIAIQMPTNSQQLTQFLVKVVSFDILPFDRINQLVFDFRSEFKINMTKLRQKAAGFENTNFIQNSGPFFWLFITWIVLAVIAGVLKLLKNNLFQQFYLFLLIDLLSFLCL